MEKSPIEILGEILDEVEGLRRTDARSHLPERLMREARAALEADGKGLGSGSQLNSVEAMMKRHEAQVEAAKRELADLSR